MKLPATLAVTLAALLSLRLLTLAADAPPGPTSPRTDTAKPAALAPENFNLHIDVLMVALPQADALVLLPQLRDPQKIEQACATIQDMLATQRAKLVGWPSVITKSGNRAVSENVDEVRYPIEFSGPAVNTVPELLVPGAPPALLRPTPPPDAELPKPHEPAKLPEPAPPSPPKPDDPAQRRDPSQAITIDPAVLDPVPDTFETKNVGTTLEVEPTLDPASMLIELNLAPQNVFFAGMDRLAIETNGRKVIVEQPRFRTNRVATLLTLKSGQAVLLDQFKSGEYPGHLEFFILRATARLVK